MFSAAPLGAIDAVPSGDTAGGGGGGAGSGGAGGGGSGAGGGGAAIPTWTVKAAEPVNMVFDPIARIRTEYCPGAAAMLHAVTRLLPAIAK